MRIRYIECSFAICGNLNEHEGFSSRNLLLYWNTWFTLTSGSLRWMFIEINLFIRGSLFAHNICLDKWLFLFCFLLFAITRDWRVPVCVRVCRGQCAWLFDWNNFVCALTVYTDKPNCADQNSCLPLSAFNSSFFFNTKATHTTFALFFTRSRHLA